MRERIITIPNIVTFIRLILVLPFIYLLAIDESLLALIVFILAVFSDKLDGALARKLKQETQFGKTFDALTDSIMVISGLVTLYLLDKATLTLVILLVGPRLITGLVFILFFVPLKIKFFTTTYSRVAALFVYVAIASIILDTTLIIYGLLICLYILTGIHWYEMVKVRKNH